MPEQISRFFLFDGELLQEYEDLLRDESAMGRQISDAIERILGLPVLTDSRATLANVRDDYDRREQHHGDLAGHHDASDGKRADQSAASHHETDVGQVRADDVAERQVWLVGNGGGDVHRELRRAGSKRDHGETDRKR